MDCACLPKRYHLTSKFAVHVIKLQAQALLYNDIPLCPHNLLSFSSRCTLLDRPSHMTSLVVGEVGVVFGCVIVRADDVGISKPGLQFRRNVMYVYPCGGVVCMSRVLT
jgi:hypothetical protein